MLKIDELLLLQPGHMETDKIPKVLQHVSQLLLYYNASVTHSPTDLMLPFKNLHHFASCEELKKSCIQITLMLRRLSV